METNTMALIKTCQIQAIMTVQLTNCNVATCMHVMAHIGACWHSTFSTFYGTTASVVLTTANCHWMDFPQALMVLL